jgi:hypothetical protein
MQKLKKKNAATKAEDMNGGGGKRRSFCDNVLEISAVRPASLYFFPFGGGGG